MEKLNLHLVVKALLYWYIFIFFSTEILSYFHLIERSHILLGEILFWSFFLFSYHRQIVSEIKKINFHSKSVLFILTLFLLTFIQGFFSAPSTTDSMVYHIPRVMYWAQEKTLFQDVIRNTHDYMAPFGEYILLHLYLIFGSDRMLFFSQWIAYVSSVVVIGIIALQLGADHKSSQLIRLFTATLPIAVMQSVNTQVDMVVTTLLIISLYLTFLLKQFYSIKTLTLLGFSLGLGFLTKATFSFYALIPLGMLIFSLYGRIRKSIFALLLTALLVIVLQLRFISQNLILYNNFLGVNMSVRGEDAVYINEVISPQAAFSNIIRNIFVHLPVPFLSTYIQSSLISLHRFIGFEISDPRITCCGTQFTVKSIIVPQEDIIANPLHLIIIILGGVFLVYKRKQFSKGVNIVLYLLATFSFIIFSSLIKWQPFHPRLEIPFFMIGITSSVVIFIRIKQYKLLYMSIFLSSLLALTIILFNVSRPYVSYTLFYDLTKSFKPVLASTPEAFYIKPREQQYFNARYYWYKPYLQMIKLLKEETSSKVAFNLDDGFEYPLWVLMNKNKIKKRVIPYSQIDKDTLIISTSVSPFNKDNYLTNCYKTEIDYGYACFSKQNSI